MKIQLYCEKMVTNELFKVLPSIGTSNNRMAQYLGNMAGGLVLPI